ncbi:MAG TPA: flagellar basal-body MS-ring/collar protein FliF [Candidatus Rifleibacterium sp.]|nr:flagellar basal-body MS-ring/collar protein FliF [Candidatus Rifleibacterium sp.]HPT45291.1 flagellar basal-body MS-ring/collar protein FliF [Candidatus Rifleibacterium sp.]
MTEFLRQLWEPIAKLPRLQQIALAAFAILVIVGIISVSMWGTQKEFIALFEEQLKIEDAGKITAKLTELNIEFKLGKDSTDILVPLTDKSYILLQLSQEKSLPQAKAGWQKLIDERSIFAGTTQQEFDLNYVRGLQNELETTLKRMGPIEEANVSIVKPKKEVFKEDQKEPAAAILLQLKPGAEINQNQIRAIRDWVCNAVEGLEPDKVRIADTEARDLTRVIEDDELMTLDKSQTTQLKITRDREKHLRTELTHILEGMFGYGRALVSVRLDMDFDQKEAVSDVVIPPVEGSNSGIVLSEKLENEKYEGRDLVEDGEPGVNSNLPPGAPSYPGTENTTVNKYERDGTIRNYEVTRSKEKFVKEQGTIRRLTVSVVLNDDPGRMTTLTDQITEIAKQTVGFDKIRGDKISLMVMPFKNDDADRAKAAIDQKKEQEKQMFMIVVGLLMSFPVFLGVIYIFVRVSRARALAREQQRLQESASEAEALRQRREQQLFQQNEQQWKDWERRFKDVKNFFPEITDVEEKKRKVQDLRLHAYQYASENDGLPSDFEEMTPEEQFIYREAFQKKSDGSLTEGLERLSAIVAERDREREDELSRLNQQANAREFLEQRVRSLIETKPDDAVQVVRLWLNK